MARHAFIIYGFERVLKLKRLKGDKVVPTGWNKPESCIEMKETIEKMVKYPDHKYLAIGACSWEF